MSVLRALRAAAAALLALAALVLVPAPASAGTYTVTATRDSWLNEATPAQNNSADTALRATAASNNTSRTRAVVGFTLPAIPSNETITSAVLQVRATTVGTSVVTVNRVTDVWAETTVTWTNTAADFDATSLGSFTPSTLANYTVNITALAQGWRDGTIANNGVMLSGAASSAARFASKENTTVANRPQLIITTAVVSPSLTVVKSSALVSDPVNLTVNPKTIPGAKVRYTILATNTTVGIADAGSTVVTQAIPAGLKFCLADAGAAGSGPVSFTDGSPSSGLTYTFTSFASTTDSLSFSNNGGAGYGYVPSADSSGCDANITHVKVAPSGSFAGKTTSGNTSFTLQMLLLVK